MKKTGPKSRRAGASPTNSFALKASVLGNCGKKQDKGYVQPELETFLVYGQA